MLRVQLTKKVRNHHMLSKRLFGPNSNYHPSALPSHSSPVPHTDRFPCIQRLKPLSPPMLFPPRTFFLNVMEERDDIPQTAIPVSFGCSPKIALFQIVRLGEYEGLRNDRCNGKKKTYFCTSTFPNVKLSIRISNSSFFAESARSIARMSSTPCGSVSLPRYPALSK
jgi:hypothetical protein